MDDGVLSKAIQEAVAGAIEAHYQTQKGQTKIVRANKIKPGERFVEMFPIRVVHDGTQEGRNATISMDGCPVVFTIIQSDPQNKRPWQTKLGVPPTWFVRIGNGEKDRYGYTDDKIIETTGNFQSSLQQCIVALLGHVFYDGVSE